MCRWVEKASHTGMIAKLVDVAVDNSIVVTADAAAMTPNARNNPTP
jgi:hypothetical protein